MSGWFCIIVFQLQCYNDTKNSWNYLLLFICNVWMSDLEYHSYIIILISEKLLGMCQMCLEDSQPNKLINPATTSNIANEQQNMRRCSNIVDQ